MTQIKFVLGLLFLVLSNVQGLAAPLFANPTALIAYAYKPYDDGKFPADPFELFTPGLKALIAAHKSGTSEDSTGGLEFDPFIDGQEFGEIKTKVGTPKLAGTKAEVPVVVNNFGSDITLTFYLVQSGGTWQIDDIVNTDPAQGWRLSELMTAQPLQN